MAGFVPFPSSKLKYLEENQISEECNQLLLTLPKEKGWVCTYIYQYQAFWLTSRFLQGVIDTRTRFRALPTDVLLATTPKSGTTWLKAIIFSLLNRRSYPVVAPNHPLTTKSPHDLVPFLEISLCADNHLPDLSSFPFPRIFSTHVPFPSLPSSITAFRCKIVYLCRDPKDNFVSMWHFANKLRPSQNEALPLNEAIEKFCRGVSLYGPFWNHVLGYWKVSLQWPSDVLFIKYEEFKRDPISNIRGLAKFLGCPFSSAEDERGEVKEMLKLCIFDILSKLAVNREGKLESGEEKNAFFRQGDVGDGANHLTPEMIERLERINEEKLYDLGLRFLLI